MQIIPCQKLAKPPFFILQRKLPNFNKTLKFSVDHLTPGYYCTLPRNMVKRGKHESFGDKTTISRNNSLDGSMDEVCLNPFLLIVMMNFHQSCH